MVPFDEVNYRKYMDTVVRSWLREHVVSSHFPGYQGKRIHYYSAVRPDAKAVIVMVHGFCEFFAKFHETAYDFYDQGYSIYFIEQRGHGRSWRAVPELDRVDVTDFSEYVEDLKALLDQIVMPQTKGLKHFLFAHSMGGAVGALFLERYSEYFNAAILSSPMLKMTFGDVPLWQVKALSGVSQLLRWNNRQMPGGQDFDGKPDFENSAALSRARYDYQFEPRIDPRSKNRYTMNSGTFRWVRAAIKATEEIQAHAADIQIPLLICQAGHDAFVDNEGQNQVASAAGNARLVLFPEAKHEIYNSFGQTLANYYRTLLTFYSEQL